MSLMAPFVDGKLQTSTSSSTSLSGTRTSNDTISSDTFLTLLVAQMQNQDPLEPTSNTEWVSQYATFTQVQQMGEMSDSMDVLRANSLVGKEVIMKVTSESTGETSYERGVVDYIVMEDGKALLNINGSNYSLSDLDTVASDEYFIAYDFYNEFVAKMDALPGINSIDASYEGAIKELYDMYSGMTEYQKEYMESYAPLYIENYNSYIDKMKDYGISYETEDTTEKEVTLDDVLDAFNSKMDELISKMAALEGTGSGDTGKTDSTTDTSGGTAGTSINTDTTTGVDGTDSDDTDSDDTEQEEDGKTTTETVVETDATVNADGTTTVETTTTTTTTTQTESGSTTSTESSTASETYGNAETDTDAVSEAVLNLLTQDI